MGKESKSSSTTTNPQAVSVFNNAQSTLGGSQYSPLSASQIQQYENPFTSGVINSTLALSNQNQNQALNANKDQALRSGAFDTSGLGVQNALTQGQYDLNNQQTIAGLNAANYSQALQTAQGENAAANQYPLALQALLGNLAQGTTSTTTGTKTTPLDFGSLMQGAGSLAEGAAKLSDRRLKRDIIPKGEVNGRKWYQFRYLWDDVVHEGVMAQENMDIAIELPSGFLAVDYGAI